MVRILLTCTIVSMLLVGCSSFKARQEQAQNIYDQTTEQFVEGLEKAETAKEQIVQSLSGASEVLMETTENLQERARKVQHGIEKVADAVESGQEGVHDVRGTLNVIEE
jgi:uncharacterized protein YcfL